MQEKKIKDLQKVFEKSPLDFNSSWSIMSKSIKWSSATGRPAHALRFKNGLSYNKQIFDS